MSFFEYDYVFIHLLLCTILLLIYYRRKVSSTNYWKVRDVPHLQPSLFFGNIMDMVLFRKSADEFFKDICDQFDDHRFFGIFEFSKPSIVVRDKQLFEQMLVKEFSSFHDRGVTVDTEYEPLSGTLINIEGRQWKNLRCKLTPTFTSGKLKSMFDQINNCAEGLIKFIDQHLPEANPFDAKLLVGRFTTNVIASCAFGLQFDATNDEISEFQTMVCKVFLSSRMSSVRMFLRMTYPSLTKKLNIKFLTQDAETYFLNLVKETLKYRRESGIVRADFLQMLMSLQEQEKNGVDMNVAREEYSAEDAVINQMQYSLEDSTILPETEKLFTDECVAAQAFVFLAAGGESASGTISMMLYAISQHPDVQKRLHEEIVDVLKNHGGRWSYQAVKDMTYLDLVMQESLRMYPISPIIIRKCNKAFRIPDSKVVIEPGTKVIFPLGAIQRDPRYYINPECFQPERFTGNNFKPSGCFLPFGDGPRICIAMRFAMLEMKVCIAKLLSKYEIVTNCKTVSPMRYKRGAMLTEPDGGMWLDFHSRKY